MKRTVCMLLLTACLLSVLCFSGCGYEKPADVNHTSEIIINEEKMPYWLVWYSVLEAPTSGGMFEKPKYQTAAVIGSDGIYENISNPQPTVGDFLGMTEEEFNASISDVIGTDYLPYEDTALYFFTVAGTASHNGKPTTYAGRKMLAEKCGEDVYLTDITEFDSEYSTDYKGRIGSRYYFESGYYDLTKHDVIPYANVNELPPTRNNALAGGTELDFICAVRDFLQNHETLSSYMKDLNCAGSYQLGNRLYAVMITENMYADDLDEYEGEDVYLVTLDTDTDQVLYLQKYHLEDYWGKHYTLYHMNVDQNLLEPMVKETNNSETP